MADLRDLELQRRLEREKKDLEVERDHGPRPLEGLSGGGAGTTWTDRQDDRERGEHTRDEERSVRESKEQVERVEQAEREVATESAPGYERKKK